MSRRNNYITFTINYALEQTSAYKLYNQYILCLMCVHDITGAFMITACIQHVHVYNIEEITKPVRITWQLYVCINDYIWLFVVL